MLYSGPLLLVFLLGFGLGSISSGQQAMQDAETVIEEKIGISMEAMQKAKAEYNRRYKELMNRATP